jgi:type III restriction enzyme
MALHKDFPKDPYAILNPEIRWFPADEDLREKGFEKLIPPLVADLRKRVFEWRKQNYEGASETSKALLQWCSKKNILFITMTAHHIILDIISHKERHLKLLCGSMK